MAAPDFFYGDTQSQRTDGERGQPSPPGESYCDDLSGGVNDYLQDKCDSRFNHMDQVGEADCPCSGPGGGGSPSAGVDLVVLIDSSSSMWAAGGAITNIAEAALANAQERCNADATVTYLYVDGSDTGASPVMPPPLTPPRTSLFQLSHEQYLIGLGVTGPFAGDGDGKSDNEQGGKAIADLCNFNEWTAENCRAILYISDERLDSHLGTIAASRSAADIAIAAALANDVTIFTHFVANINGNHINTVPPGHPDRPAVASHYQDMADQTGGGAQIDMNATVITEELYVRLISEAICGGCGNSGECATAELPALEPCLSITWGDSECDCMEGDDHEEICITVCNCYDNITFSNVRIAAIAITDEFGRQPPLLPDGSPSSELYPVGPYCFGDIGPCVDGEPSCVSRNAMVINRGLPAGTWKVRVVGLCFDVNMHYDERVTEFEFTVCKN